jgi:hypothetical protein
MDAASIIIFVIISVMLHHSSNALERARCLASSSSLMMAVKHLPRNRTNQPRGV